MREEKKVRAELVLGLELGGRTPSSSQVAAPPLRHGSFQHPFSSNSNARSEQNILAVHEQRPYHQQHFRYVVVTDALRRAPCYLTFAPYLRVFVAYASPLPPPRILSSLSRVACTNITYRQTQGPE